MTNLATWGAFVTAIAAGVGVIIQWRRQPAEVRQTSVSTDMAVSTEARQLLVELRQERDDMRAERAHMVRELADLRGKFEKVRAELTTAEHKIQRLEEWVRAQGANPRDVYGSSEPDGTPQGF